MRRHFRRLALVVTAISLVVVSCTGSPSSDARLGTAVAESISATQTVSAEVARRVEATLGAQTLEPPDAGTTEAEQAAYDFVNTYGFAAAYTGDPAYAAMAAHVNGEKLVAMTQTDSSGAITAVTGGIWVAPDGASSVVAYSGEDGMPSRAIVGDTTYIFENYTDTTVDVAIVSPGGQVNVVRGVEIGSAIQQEIRELTLGSGRAPGLARDVLPGESLSLADALKLAGLIVGTAICVAGIIGGTALTGLGGLAIGLACFGALLNAVMMIVGEVDEMEQAGLIVAVFDCATAVTGAHNLVTCVPGILDTISAMARSAEETQEEESTAINLAESSLIYGGGAVQMTLTWSGGTDLDLWVTDPSGERIGFSHPHSASGGRLDVDDTDGYGPENIFWPTGGAPAGTYLVEVHHYSGRGSADYQILLQVNGTSQNFAGTLAPDELQTVTSFTQ